MIQFFYDLTNKSNLKESEFYAIANTRAWESLFPRSKMDAVQKFTPLRVVVGNGKYRGLISAAIFGYEEEYNTGIKEMEALGWKVIDYIADPEGRPTGYVINDVPRYKGVHKFGYIHTDKGDDYSAFDFGSAESAINHLNADMIADLGLIADLETGKLIHWYYRESCAPFYGVPENSVQIKSLQTQLEKIRAHCELSYIPKGSPLNATKKQLKDIYMAVCRYDFTDNLISIFRIWEKLYGTVFTPEAGYGALYNIKEDISIAVAPVNGVEGEYKTPFANNGEEKPVYMVDPSLIPRIMTIYRGKKTIYFPDNCKMTLEVFNMLAEAGVDIPEESVVELPNLDEAHARILKRDNAPEDAFYGVLLEENENGSLAITIRTPRISAEEFMAGNFLSERTLVTTLSGETFTGSDYRLYDLYQAVSDFGTESQFTGTELRRLYAFSKAHKESLVSLKTDSIEDCVKIFYPSLRSKDWKWDPSFKDRFQQIFHFHSEDLDKFIEDNQRKNVTFKYDEVKVVGDILSQIGPETEEVEFIITTKTVIDSKLINGLISSCPTIKITLKH
jgi:hypothetical protein